jgi:RNA ligase
VATTVSLREILDPDLLVREIEAGAIVVRAHPADESLKILTYSKLVQITGRWNEATKTARGLIVRTKGDGFDDAQVIARPWRKMFTLTQLGHGSTGAKSWALGDEENPTSVEAGLADLDFDAPAQVTDKVDGSMGIFYRAPDGRPALATKGSFDSDQAGHFTALLRRTPKYLAAAEELLARDETYIAELTGPTNQIVLFYPQDDIIMLGAVDRRTGEYFGPEKAAGVWDAAHGLSVTETMPARNLGEAVALADRAGKEGVVVRLLADHAADYRADYRADHSAPSSERAASMQMMIKVKQQDYVALHRLVMSFSEGAVRQAITQSTPTFADLAQVATAESSLLLPQVRAVVEFNDNPYLADVRARRLEQFDAAIVPAAQGAVRAVDVVAAIPDEFWSRDPREVMKEFAVNLVSKASGETGAPPAVLFVLAKARLAGHDLWATNASAVMEIAARSIKGGPPRDNE